jgi:hypothetical protein
MAERIRIVRLTPKAVASRDRNEVVLTPVAVLVLRPEANRPGVREQEAIGARLPRPLTRSSFADAACS